MPRPGADPGYGGSHLAADVEGLTLLTGADGNGRLFASSQGDNTFAVYDRGPGDGEGKEQNKGNGDEYEGGFRVGAAGGALDGSEECDGAAVLGAPLGRTYPNGLLVVQDGHDTPADGEREGTGFKFVDLGDVLERVED
ncbi:hypothetical protein GCM10009863_29370 [Streptomyces axinellae]|uniref:BPP domain-containing protein n=1 Tax=Streptomyces axinellae TaxID=552788 RepID=A0ABP6CFR8_9ACTN